MIPYIFKSLHYPKTRKNPYFSITNFEIEEKEMFAKVKDGDLVEIDGITFIKKIISDGRVFAIFNSIITERPIYSMIFAPDRKNSRNGYFLIVLLEDTPPTERNINKILDDVETKKTGYKTRDNVFYQKKCFKFRFSKLGGYTDVSLLLKRWDQFFRRFTDFKENSSNVYRFKAEYEYIKTDEDPNDVIVAYMQSKLARKFKECYAYIRSHSQTYFNSVLNVSGAKYIITSSQICIYRIKENR